MSYAASLRVRSAAIAPTAPLSVMARSRCSRLRETIATLAPSALKARAHASPMPLLPPVINTTLPARPSSTCSPSRFASASTRANYRAAPSLLLQQRGEDDTEEHHTTQPVVVQESAETTLRVTGANKKVLMHDKHRRPRKSNEIRPGQLRLPSHPAHDREKQRVGGHDRRDIETAEEQRRGFDADLCIIRAIHHCVLRIVGDSPCDVGSQ